MPRSIQRVAGTIVEHDREGVALVSRNVGS